MIDHFNNMLRHLFLAQIDEITSEDQVRFQPPDEEWRRYVSGLTVGGEPVNALNVYLADIRENRKLHSNARVRHVENGFVSQTPAPRRIDCHYLISAWSPAAATVHIEQTMDESALLYKVIAALMNNEPLVPSRVYDPDPLPGTFPRVIAEAELPTTILPAEGFPKLAEFWGSMGAGYRWKPAVYLVVTLPVALAQEPAVPMVTTRITEYRQGGQPETAETWIQIGGHVLDATRVLPDGSAAPPVPVSDAWVALERPSGERLQTTETNNLGRFTFAMLRAGPYQLRARATGLGETDTGPIEVPSPTGEYNLHFR